MSTQAVARESKRRAVNPPVDIFEDKDGILLLADMPGVSKDSLSVTVHDQELTISGQREGAPEGEAVHRGIRSADYQRTFALHQSINTEEIEAKLKNGVLTVFLPKTDAVKNREIEIQTV